VHEVIAYGVWPSIYPEPQKFSIFISYLSYNGNCDVELAAILLHTFVWLLVTYIFVVIDNKPFFSCHVTIKKCPVYSVYTAIGSFIWDSPL